MNIRAFVSNARTLLGVALCIGIVATGNAYASGHQVTVAIHTSAQGLDLTQQAGAREFYLRIKNAAWVACTRADRAGLEPVEDAQKCTEQSLADAIRAAGLPALTRIFLENHTLQAAAALGIHEPLTATAK